MRLKIIPLLLILLLPIIINSSYSQQTFDSPLSLELSSIYGFKGETLDITIISEIWLNSRLILINPEETTIFNQTISTNIIRSFPMSDNLKYGTYKIIAYKNGYKEERLFTLVNLKDYEKVNFPYQVFHKDLLYTFYANYSIIVENNLDKLTINLDLLKDLTNKYLVTVKVLANNMTLLLKLTKHDIEINILFMFIHKGCKFFINGTLDKPRDFTFSFSKVKSFYSHSVYSQSGICFDFSDVKELATLRNNKVVISIPKIFSFDPIVFSSGFEDLILNEWDSKTEYEDASVETERTNLTKAYGDYSLNVTIITDATGNQIGRVKKDVGYREDLIYVRTYFKISTYPNENDDFWDLIEYLYSTSGRGGVGLYNNSNNLYFGISNYNATSTSYEIDYSDSVNDLKLDWWYCLQLMIDYDSGNTSIGESRLWLDGDLLINATGLNNYVGLYNPDNICVGVEIATPEQEYNVFHDAVKVDLTAYIPCEEVAPEENEEDEEPEPEPEDDIPDTTTDINNLFLLLSLFLIILGILTIYKPIIMIIGLSLSGVLLIFLTNNDLTTFIRSLTIICVFIYSCFMIVGISRNRGL